MYCNMCGRELIDGVGYCLNCGTLSLEGESSVRSVAEQDCTEDELEYTTREAEAPALDMKDVLTDLFCPYEGESLYYVIGTPIKEHNTKRNKVVKFSGMDSKERVYMIYDSSILSSCKKFFAVTENGIYYQKRRNGFISWQQFKNMEIKLTEYDFMIGDISFLTNKKDGSTTLTLLTMLKNSIT